MTDDEALRRIAHNLRRFRGKRTLTEVAALVGTYPMTIQRIEHEAHMPGAGLLTRIAAGLGVGVNELLMPVSDTARTTLRKFSESQLDTA